MVEFGDRLGFVLESIEAITSLCHLVRQHLDRHLPIQALVMRPVHHPHPASADFGGDAVVPEGATNEVTPCW